MNRNNLTKFIIVLVVLIWSFSEMYPPLGTNLADAFRDQAQARDAAFTNILQRLEPLQKQNPEQAFGNLLTAIGTNDITRYFAGVYDVKAEVNPNRAVLNRLQKDNAGKIKKGLDLQGGTSFLVVMDTSKIGTNKVSSLDQSAALSQAVQVLRTRVDKFGVAEPVIQPEGEDRILIQLPGLSDADTVAARETIQRVAFLQLRMVSEESANLNAQNLTEAGSESLPIKFTDPNTGASTIEHLWVKLKPILTGKSITAATMGRDQSGQPEINFALDSEGAEIFGQVTAENVGHRLAIVLDGELLSAPVIKQPIMGGQVQITGQFTDKEAHELATALENPLQYPVKIMSESSVDPTLGKDTVHSGVNSAFIGTILVAGFMAVYYLFAGVVANVALVTNIIILLGVMCAIPATFTLPGIAGVVLTVGMAVDANVLIFERIREETAKGKSLRGALAAGYDRAFGTIFDSHVTTLISSLILIWMGTGPVQGFGMTLTIGVAASLFTALVVTRLIFDFLLARGWLKSLHMFHLIRATKLDFMALAKPAFIISWTIIIIGLGCGLYRGKGMLGVELAGGDHTTLAFSERVDAQKLREAIAKDADIKEPVIQYQKVLGQSQSTEYLSLTTPYGTASNVLQVLNKDFPSAHFVSKGTDKVGPTIGAEIMQAALVASLLSLLGILVYVAVRYDTSFAVGAVLAVIHDVLMTIGCYCLTGLFGEGRQFNPTMVAAVLTIIGFSINDTIVIFDRIREDLKMGVRGSFREVINQALNQTLSRTLITSGTVFLATMSLYLFGGGAINDFAFTFLVGIITGTYSSIYIASALVLWWHKGARPRMGAGAQVSTGNAVSARP